MIKTLDPAEYCSRGELTMESLAARAPVATAEPALDPMESGGTAGRARCAAADRIGKSFVYMLRHLDQRLHMAALGRIAGLSASTFYHLFKTATGCTPNSFLTRARMHSACGLLRDTNLRVKEVAAALGYNDQFYFSRVFKSVSAVAPVQYRCLHWLLQQEIKDRLDPQNNGVCDALRRFEIDAGADCSPFAPAVSPEPIKTKKIT